MGIPTKIASGSVEEGDVALTQGTIAIGNASGVGAELDVSTDTGIMIGNGTTATVAALSGDVTMTNAGVVTIGADKVTESKTADSDGTSGLYIMKHVLALYDFATDGGGAPGAVTLTDAVTIPDNAVIQCVGYEVLTTCTSAGDAGTLKLNLVTDGDLTTAIAINNGGNPWDAGLYTAHEGNGAFATAPTPRKTTAARLLQVTTATEAFTAGKIVFHLQYWVSS